jgi:DNA-binding CsgD family transcriptional regulator
VDSPKRSAAGKRLQIEESEDAAVQFAFHTDGQLPGMVNFNDLISTTTTYLTEREKRVLQGLASGLPLRAIAARSKISYPTALKCRRRIADVMTRLEFEGGATQNSKAVLLPMFATFPGEPSKRTFTVEGYG